MQRTQIYFEQDTLQDLKDIARISVSEFIRKVMKQEIKKKKERNLNSFITNMKPIESFEKVDATEYVKNLRSSGSIWCLFRIKN